MDALAPDHRPQPPTTAVVQVASDGTATLYLGAELVEHAARVNAATAMRVLLDYTATIDTRVRVTTQMPDGKWTRHRLDPDGTMTPIPRNVPHARPTNDTPDSEAKRSRRARTPSPLTTRITSRCAAVVTLAFLVTALLMIALFS